MERITPPFVPEKVVPVLTIDQMRALLDNCQGREFVQVGDTAIIRLLLGPGGRFGEISALTVEDIEFDMDVAHAVGKGRRPRALPFGDKTGAALARYLRARARERQELWLARRTRPLAGRWDQPDPPRQGDDTTDSRPARPHLPPHGRTPVDGRRRLRNRPDVHHGLALPTDSPPLRCLGRMTSARVPRTSASAWGFGLTRQGPTIERSTVPCCVADRFRIEEIGRLPRDGANTAAGAPILLAT